MKSVKSVTMGDAVRHTGLSRTALVMNDDLLKPDRTAAGQRRYAIEDLNAFMAKRQK